MDRQSAAHDSDPRRHVVIVGTGFAGLGMAIRLKQRGMHDFTILEAADDVGGTWRDNHYPGAACDVMSHLYSFSFEPNPRWSHVYGRQAEILAYMRHCADKHGLRAHCRFGRAVTSASFDETSGLWTVRTSRGEELRARCVVSGTGGLSRPSLPDLEGLESFRGKTFHSARWDHGYDLAGKRVAIVGTGASAIQIVPEVAKKAAKLTVFQRTPPWIVPRLDRAIGPVEQAIYEKIPATQWAYRQLVYWRAELGVLGFVVDPRIMTFASRVGKKHLASQVRDPALRAALTPDYAFGCKRVLISDDYYPALQRPNVELVSEAAASLREGSVVSASGREHEVDAVIFCSGFQASESCAPFSVRGLGGRDLNETWAEGAEAHLGTTVSGFPNFFMLVGPNTGLGHSSMVFMIEAQIDYVLSCLDLMEERELAFLDVRPEAQARFNETIHRKLEGSVWASGCKSWYRTASGKNTTLWPGFTFDFRLRTARVDPSEYRLVPEKRLRPRAEPAPRLQPRETLN